MTDGATDNAGVMIPPPLVYGAGLLIGLGLDYLWPLALLPDRGGYPVAFFLLAASGAVSEGVAAGMARGVAELLDTDVGVGITGIAGPGGGTGEKPVGTVWFAVAVKGVVRTSHQVFSGDREAVRERATQAALILLYEMLMS